MKRFILLTKHTDEELTLILQEFENKGFRFTKQHGNIFEFKEISESGTVCVRSFYSKDKTSPMPAKVSEQCVCYRNLGWDTICISGPETLSDSKRHIFLIKERDDAQSVPVDKEKEEKTKNIAFRKVCSSSCLCLLFLLLSVLVIKKDFLLVSTSNFYLFSFLFFTCSFMSLTILNVVSFVEFFSGKPERRTMDKSSLLLTVLLFCLALFLLFDTMWNSKKRPSEIVKAGNSRFEIYNDTIPFSLEFFGADTSGKYRTKRSEYSNSLFASCSHFFDESFSTSEVENNYDTSKLKRVSFISYKIYKSEIPFFTKTVAKQMGDKCIFFNENIAVYLSSNCKITVDILSDFLNLITGHQKF